MIYEKVGDFFHFLPALLSNFSNQLLHLGCLTLQGLILGRRLLGLIKLELIISAEVAELMQILLNFIALISVKSHFVEVLIIDLIDMEEIFNKFLTAIQSRLR